MAFFKRISMAVAAISITAPFKSAYAIDGVERKIEFCGKHSTENNLDGSEFNPLYQSAQTVATSNVATLSGQSLSKIAQIFGAENLVIGETFVLSGRAVVWIFEVGNPLAVALGYLLIPSVSAKCDVLYSNDPDCLKQACIQPLSRLK